MLRYAALALAVLPVLHACGGDDDDASEGGTAVASLDGLYDATTTVGDEVDELYIEIVGDQFTNFDYQGDAYDQGENCYFEIGPLTLIPMGNDRYRVGENAPENEVKLVREGNELAVEFVDTDDSDNDGDLAETLQERYPVAVGVSSTDFNACEGVMPGDPDTPDDNEQDDAARALKAFLR